MRKFSPQTAQNRRAGETRSASLQQEAHSRELIEYVREHKPELIATIRRIVEIESPTHDKSAVDRCGELLAEEFARRGGRVKLHRNRTAGNQLQVDFPATKSQVRPKTVRGKATPGNTRAPLLLLGHHDTVWDLGTLRTMPLRETHGRLYGPGVFDMKAGIAMMLFALDSIREVCSGLSRPITVLLNPDEETGSSASRHITEKMAKRCSAVLVLEPANGPDGKCKTARKGVGDFTVEVTGRAAHSGLDFEKGQNAIIELAHQVRQIAGFTDLKRGITFNPGLIRGGTRTNVVPAEASVEIDVRIPKARDAAYVARCMRSLRPANRGCKLFVEGGINRPPLERTAAVAKLYELARNLAGKLGFDLGEIAVGGGSDGNFTGALGIPTLDGLGAVGEGAHAANECVVLSELPRRVALIAGLLQVL
jgi:glutamate carboxypeptidase